MDPKRSFGHLDHVGHLKRSAEAKHVFEKIVSPSVLIQIAACSGTRTAIVQQSP
jgi:hypothetical protein